MKNTDAKTDDDNGRSTQATGSPSSWSFADYAAEIEDRFRHFYGQVGGTYRWPNSAEGDLLKMTHAALLKWKTENAGLSGALRQEAPMSEQKAHEASPLQRPVRPRWSKLPLAAELLGATILVEKHSASCSCSYCTGFRGRLGVALPECKARNSWRVLYLRISGELHVLRWTLPKWPNDKLRDGGEAQHG